MLHFTWPVSVSLPVCMLTGSLLSSSVLASSVILLTWLCLFDSLPLWLLSVYISACLSNGETFYRLCFSLPLQKDCSAVDALPFSIQLPCVGIHKQTWERKSVSRSMQLPLPHTPSNTASTHSRCSRAHTLWDTCMCVFQVHEWRAEILLSLGTLAQDVQSARTLSQPGCRLTLLERLEHNINNYLLVVKLLHIEVRIHQFNLVLQLR